MHVGKPAAVMEGEVEGVPEVGVGSVDVGTVEIEEVVVALPVVRPGVEPVVCC